MYRQVSQVGVTMLFWFSDETHFIADVLENHQNDGALEEKTIQYINETGRPPTSDQKFS